MAQEQQQKEATIPFLTKISPEFFHEKIPYKPMGKYVHFLTIRVTESYPLFQTDGELNKARVRAGIADENKAPISRLAMFKRKQSTPERLVGRELLRNYGLINKECEYNEKFAMNNADCIIYGFAIGDSGSEKSKVVVDTAFSITAFDESHETFTLNAPYESGTMSKQGRVTSRINQQDHIKPQIFFPSIVTLRDPTEATFLYVVNNILRTRHYGAQTTRTGRVRNELIGVVFADGEIVSNLRWTQAIYDLMKNRGQIKTPDPLDENDVIDAAETTIKELMNQEFIVHTNFIGNEFQELLEETKKLIGNEEKIKQILTKANADAECYFNEYVKKGKATTGAN
jgi:CRISPR-associated protein Csc2